ncbi:hypothetical protein PT2222_490001 [Paraburkholderia tropica]
MAMRASALPRVYREWQGGTKGSSDQEVSARLDAVVHRECTRPGQITERTFRLAPINLSKWTSDLSLCRGMSRKFERLHRIGVSGAAASRVGHAGCTTPAVGRIHSSDKMHRGVRVKR